VATVVGDVAAWFGRELGGGKVAESIEHGRLIAGVVVLRELAPSLLRLPRGDLPILDEHER
jgi:hypothetical protein